MRLVMLSMFLLLVSVLHVAHAGSIEIDFETPALVGIDWLAADSYTDPSSGVVFVAEISQIGPVVNAATTACVDPPDRDQKLGMGTESGGLGRSGGTMFVYFPEPLLPPVQISVDIQSAMDSAWAVTLFHPVGVEAGEGTVYLTENDGNCGYPGGWRSVRTATVTADVPVAWAAIGPASGMGSGFVFVIDDMVIESPTLDESVSNETVPWSAIKARYVR